MKPHVKNYLKAHGYGEQDFIPCEECGRQAVDIHHKIFRSQGGTDEVDNLIAFLLIIRQLIALLPLLNFRLIL